MKSFQKISKNLLKTLYKIDKKLYINTVERNKRLLAAGGGTKGCLAERKMLIIFPLIIYYSGSNGCETHCFLNF